MSTSKSSNKNIHTICNSCSRIYAYNDRGRAVSGGDGDLQMSCPTATCQTLVVGSTYDKELSCQNIFTAFALSHVQQVSNKLPSSPARRNQRARAAVVENNNEVPHQLPYPGCPKSEPFQYHTVWSFFIERRYEIYDKCARRSFIPRVLDF